VLVVEDDPQTRELYRSWLRSGGYAVVAVPDGIDALRFAETTVPAAVVLDFGLPRLHGRDVHREMAAHGLTEQVPIIVVTGESGKIDEHDFACVLRKPINSDELLAAVENCLRKRQRKPAAR
jgi:DNA-binding response OmpR family regulator